MLIFSARSLEYEHLDLGADIGPNDCEDGLHEGVVHPQLAINQHAERDTPGDWHAHELPSLCGNTRMHVKPE